MSSFKDAAVNFRNAQPRVPHGEVVASFDEYLSALGAIDKLVRAEFPVTNASIIGSELKSVERITARLNYGRAAGAGALRGAWFGALFGLLTIVIAGQLASAQLLLAIVALTVGFGALLGIARYSVMRKKRDFASVSELVATKYDVVVSGELAARARTVLGTDAVA